MGAGRALNNESPSAAFIGISLACVIISQALAYLTSVAGEWPGLMSACAFLAIGVQWIVFLPSAWFHSEKFFDITGSFTYAFLAVFSLVQGGTFHGRQILVTVFVLIWSARLGTFLFIRVSRAGKDGRFEQIKENMPRFFNMWTIQGLWVFLTALPVFCLNSTKEDADFPSWCDYLGMVCFGLGFACEVIADNQKTAFAADPENEGKFISTGLWKFSRHPNYFGEIMLWVGIFFVCSSVFSGFQWVAVESPAFVAFLLMKVSGIPLLEARADEKWGEDQAYQAYKATTPELVPWPTAFSFDNLSDTPGNGGDLEELLIGDDQQPIVETSQV